MAISTNQRFEDHLEIQQLLNLYANAIDTHKWDALEAVFTEDSKANFLGFGIYEGRQAIVDLLRSVLIQCASTQHSLATIDINVLGDNAKSHCYLTAMHAGLGKYDGEIFTVWGSYADELVRTTEGWRITHRTLTTTHSSGDIGLFD